MRDKPQDIGKALDIPLVSSTPENYLTFFIPNTQALSTGGVPRQHDLEERELWWG